MPWRAVSVGLQRRNNCTTTSIVLRFDGEPCLLYVCMQSVYGMIGRLYFGMTVIPLWLFAGNGRVTVE